MKPGSAILNPYPSDIPKEEEIKNAPSAGKIMVTIFWDKKGVVLLKFLPRRITMNSDPYSKTLRNPNAGLRRRRATKKKSLFPLHDSPELHTSVRTTESITNYGKTMIPHPPYSPDLAQPYYHLFVPL